MRSGELSKMSKTEASRKKQDIVIIHVGKSHQGGGKEVRVPITGDDVNIIEIKSERKKENRK